MALSKQTTSNEIESPSFHGGIDLLFVRWEDDILFKPFISSSHWHSVSYSFCDFESRLERVEPLRDGFRCSARGVDIYHSILKTPLLFISNKVMKTFWGNVHYGSSWTEHLRKQCRKVESNFEERDRSSARVTLVVLEWYEASSKLQLLICESGEKCCALRILEYTQDDFCYYARLSLWIDLLTKATSYTHDWAASTQEHSTTKKRTAINYCSEIERPLQRIKISAAVLASVSGKRITF